MPELILRNGHLWEPKAWGWTRLAYHDPNYSLHFCEGLQGGYSSIHYHRRKWNRFIVRTATLEILLPGYPPLILGPGEHADIEAGVSHGFKVLESGKFWECYWPSLNTVALDDIARLTRGGRFNHGGK